MNLHFLNESPIHFIDAIQQRVEVNHFTPDLALIMLNITMMIKAMNHYNYSAINKIASSDAKTTQIALSSFQNHISDKNRNDAIDAFVQENKTKILNDLIWLKRQLIDKLYRPAGVQVHNDVWK